MQYFEADYVEWWDRLALDVDDMTAPQRARLRYFNRRLIKLEQLIKCEIQTLVGQADARVFDPGDWVKDYEIEGTLNYVLHRSDPAFDEDSDNVLYSYDDMSKHELWEFGISSTINHNEWENSRHPMGKERHCWLYHDLTDHSRLGWANVLRVGDIWMDISIEYQQQIEL